MKRKLIVLVGKPGAGKTTLIETAFPGEKFVDVLPYIERFRLPDGSVPEDKTITAYEKMYQDMARIDNDLVILELGTNHPEFNIKKLEKLKQTYEIIVYLCLASVETCWTRARERGMRHTTESFELRMKRNFPATHQKLLDDVSLNYKLIDMERPLSETAAEIREN